MDTRGLKLIGKGTFSKCYKLNDKEVLIRSNDNVKEYIALWMDYVPFIPNIERIDIGLYKMEYFPKVKSLKKTLKPKQYEIYKELRSLSVGFVANKHNLFYEWHEQFDTIKNKRFREGLKLALDCLANYGSDINFEISPRNVAVKNGNLILLDCFFMSSQLQDVRTGKYQY